MNIATADSSRAGTSLDVLPSELRRLIVSFLAPAASWQLRPGCKNALKSANLAHRCLHEWATEYLFRDMALLHIVPGMSSSLELLSMRPEFDQFRRYVKHVVVKIPPAIRWEAHIVPGVAARAEVVTRYRLAEALAARDIEVDAETQHLCAEYFIAMVKPFTNGFRWVELLDNALYSWSHIFGRFNNVEKISVECCGRLEHPETTYTNTFLQQRGLNLEDGLEYDPWIEDSSINKAWASSLILGLHLPSVRSLDLTWANTDNLDRFTTVNRLLGTGYRSAFKGNTSHLSRLTLTIRGVKGTHGSRGWEGRTGSAAGVRFWQKALNSMPNLEFLNFVDDLTSDEELMFTDSSMSNSNESVLEWLLPGLKAPKLRTLRFDRVLFDKSTIATLLQTVLPYLKNLVLKDANLTMANVERGSDLTESMLRHVQGKSWVDLCCSVHEIQPACRVQIICPFSNIHESYQPRFRLHSKYVKELQKLEEVDIHIGDSRYSSEQAPDTLSEYRKSMTDTVLDSADLL